MATYKTAVVGDISLCLPLQALGIDALITDNNTEIESELMSMIDSGEYGAIFIAESLAERLSEIIESVRYEPLPSIILIPDVTGSRGLGRSAIRETMKRAAGRDIMGEGE